MSIGSLDVDARVSLPLEEKVVIGVIVRCRVLVDRLLVGGGGGGGKRVSGVVECVHRTETRVLGVSSPAISQIIMASSLLFVSEESVFPAEGLLAVLPCLEPDRVDLGPEGAENVQQVTSEETCHSTTSSLKPCGHGITDDTQCCRPHHARRTHAHFFVLSF